ncbi:uncharacterized protein LOC111079655 [Drosophila obscura]|uniref:uncharacterized protein LOC111079655 n=1 Tax=Drosophila obscura TaxID=7282 RepID=UPI000BA00234|nr:uncharacterized protein LOC111079655 [Drosophila obscura]
MVEETHLTNKPKLCCWNCGQCDHGFRDCVAKEQNILLPLWGARDVHANMSQVFGKRSGGRDEGGRSSPRNEASEEINNTHHNKILQNNNQNNILNKNNLKFLPAEEKMRRYMEVRNQIFDDRQLEERRSVSHRLQKARSRFRKRRQTRKEVAEAVRRGAGRDPGMFAEVQNRGKRIAGLLDTGASVSLLWRSTSQLSRQLPGKTSPLSGHVFGGRLLEVLCISPNSLGRKAKHIQRGTNIRSTDVTNQPICRRSPRGRGCGCLGSGKKGIGRAGKGQEIVPDVQRSRIGNNNGRGASDPVGGGR